MQVTDTEASSPTQSPTLFFLQSECFPPITLVTTTFGKDMQAQVPQCNCAITSVTGQFNLEHSLVKKKKKRIKPLSFPLQIPKNHPYLFFYDFKH